MGWLVHVLGLDNGSVRWYLCAAWLGYPFGMTKPKYATAAERQVAVKEKARKQMLAQWERQRAQAGSDLGYYGCHRRVRTQRGRAGDQPCEECGRPARDWSHVHGTDPAVPANYRALCQPCHWAYDDVIARKNETLGPEGRSALAYKAWETKRRNA